MYLHEWYITSVPAWYQEIIDGFIARYPKFTLLPADASHHQIIAEGINGPRPTAPLPLSMLLWASQ